VKKKIQPPCREFILSYPSFFGFREPKNTVLSSKLIFKFAFWKSFNIWLHKIPKRIRIFNEYFYNGMLSLGFFVFPFHIQVCATWS